MKAFFHWHAKTFRGDDAKLDGVFKFLRSCEYSLPEYFAAVEVMVQKAGGEANYQFFVAGMPRWFRSDALKMLEEQGVPIQISERFLRRSDTVQRLGGRLRRLAEQLDPRLSKFERTWILDALPRAT